MPKRLFSLLDSHDTAHIEKPTANLLPVLSRLIEQGCSVEKCCLCDGAVRHIGKIKGEGNNFCGYRNIQMLVTYILGARAEGCKKFERGVPSVLGLQDLIEEAWNMGINESGRAQTGGVRGTRKHVGTPEVCMYLARYKPRHHGEPSFISIRRQGKSQH